MKHFKTNASPDIPDSRDQIYIPSLRELKSSLLPNHPLIIRNQGSEGACTGFSLAAVINFLNQNRQVDVQVSPRMLYEMARKNDEWPGEDYDGSSLRGAIKGWKNMGVCREEQWPYLLRGGIPHLTIEAAKDARNHTIGAYYRIMPEIAHFHSALNETGVIAASARVHEGWRDPATGTIQQSRTMIGGHAFAIVGYTPAGFIVQNSWGRSWGREGTAIWLYEDWIEHVMDAWVLSLAIPTPQVFGKQAQSYKGYRAVQSQGVRLGRAVDRAEIAGHFVHIDDGKYHDKKRYWSTAEDVEQTAELVAASDQYKHVLFYFHGGLNSPKASAKRIRAMKDGFKRNGVYPYHIMYDTGLVEELKDLIVRKGSASTERVGGFSDWSDRLLEGVLRKTGRLVWDEMKKDAKVAFQANGDGLNAVNRFIKHLGAANGKKKKKIHLCGHSTGAIVIAHLLNALQNRMIEITSCSLLAPAASAKLFNTHYLPIYQNKKKLKLKILHIYNLLAHLEEADTVIGAYRKSLLYLVSNSFERDGRDTPLVGMQKFSEHITQANGMPKIYYSDGRTGSTTRSQSHGGFDNDPYTMNHVLKSIVGKAPDQPFTKDELDF